MNFFDIKNMGDLKKIISEDNYYASLLYFVSFYDSRSTDKRVLKAYKKLRFGNESSDTMKIVNIMVYKDKVDLHCAREGSKHHERVLDEYKKYSEESCIIQALDEWKCYYRN